MLVATKTVTADGDVLRKGISRVAEDHPVARRYRDHFAPASRGPRGGDEVRTTLRNGKVVAERPRRRRAPVQRRSTSSGTPAQRPKRSWRLPVDEAVELRPNAPARVDAKLTATVRRVIREECIAAADLDVETGGALLASSIRAGSIELDGATGPGPNARQRSDGLQIDNGHIDDHEDLLRRVFESRSRLAGIWHTHPTVGNGGPSERDLLTFAHLLDHTDEDYVVAIIATPRRSHDGEEFLWWSTPELTAWTVRRLHSGQAVCEPARLA